MKWIPEGIGATEIECKGCMFSWPQKQSRRVLLLLEAFSFKKKHCLYGAYNLRLESAK